MERPRRSYTDEYKQQTVELVMSSGRSITSVAKELGLRDSVLRRWVDKVRQRADIGVAAPHHAGDADVGGPGLGTRPAAPGERTAAHGARHYKKVDRDLCRNTDMSFSFIEDHRDSYPVRLMCNVLEVSPAGYYAWRDRPVSERSKSNAALLAEIRQVHHDSQRPLRQSSRPCRPATAGPWRQSRPDRTDDAPERHPRRHGKIASRLHD